MNEKERHTIKGWIHMLKVHIKILESMVEAKRMNCDTCYIWTCKGPPVGDICPYGTEAEE